MANAGSVTHGGPERPGVIARYADWLPITPQTPRITLKEGDTPLLKARAIEEEMAKLGAALEVYLKFEGANPTGSFKDRGMVVAIAKAVEEGARAVICASTGNTSASAAAYAALTGVRCVVLIPAGNIAMGKLAQALVYGAQVVAINGNFDDALSLVRQIACRRPIALVNSINPYRIEGQKTAAFEICDVLGDAPDYLVIPVGNAGNITAYWKGFKEYRSAGNATKLPKMLGFQAEGAAPIVRGHVIPEPKTIATAINIGNPASWKSAVAARDESGGLIEAVSDEEIMEAYKLVASREGVFAEAASCASVAGLLKLARSGYFAGEKGGRPKRAVCVLTGHGLKDPGLALKAATEPEALPPSLEAIERAIGF